MKANNPTGLGLWELKRIWPGSSKPSVVVSVGTGSRAKQVEFTHASKTHIHDGYLSRAYRAFMSSPSLDGQTSWLDLLNGLDDEERENYHRLNLSFDDAEPELDDASCMPDIRQKVLAQYVESHKRKNALWASRFFFEICEKPQYYCGYYRCSGTILCIFRDARPLVSVITRAYQKASFVLQQNKIFPTLAASACCKSCGMFWLPVSFETTQLYQSIEIALVLDDAHSCHISGFPHPLQWFVDQQKNPISSEIKAVNKCSCSQPRSKKRRHSSVAKKGGRSLKRDRKRTQSSP
jgi:hypothetical protein